jgi:hypothetical protein
MLTSQRMSLSDSETNQQEIVHLTGGGKFTS